MSGSYLSYIERRRTLRLTLRRSLLALTLVTVVGLAMSKRDTIIAQTANAIGFVRFAHTAVDVGAIDIYRGSSPTPLVTNLDYGQFTDFIALPASPVGYVARLTGSGPDGAILFKLDWGLRPSTSDMIIASGLYEQKAFILDPLTIVRNNTRGKARVRVFNTVWGGRTLTLKSGQGMIFAQDLQYLKLGDSEVDPGLYDFEVSSGSGERLAVQSGVGLEADKIYVLLIIGGKDGKPPINILPIVSNEETTRVRFANKLPKAGQISVKGTVSPLVANLVVNSLSDYTAIPSGTTTFVLRDVSSPENSSIASLATQLYPGHDVTITLSAVDKTVQLTLVDDGLTAATPTPTATATAASTPAAQQYLSQRRVSEQSLLNYSRCPPLLKSLWGDE